MSVYLQDPDVTIHQGDVLDVLRELPSGSVHMCCTSPPFYGLRDYGTGTWEGGDESCDHLAPPGGGTKASGLANYDNGLNQDTIDAKVEQRRQAYPQLCGKCGARRVDQQIGLEATPDEWVARLVAVFREVRRVLRDDGTLWVEVGDSYNSQGTQGTTSDLTYAGNSHQGYIKRKLPNLKHKDLIGAPWLLAFALRADGWYLRSEIIWAKPNPMPESVQDRPTTSHSRVFLLSKQPRYFYDAEALREDATALPQRRFSPQIGGRQEAYGGQNGHSGSNDLHDEPRNWGNRNRRTVWTIATQPYPEAHFATWPQALCRDMILAGTSERGVCPECGAPWERIVERDNPSGTTDDPIMPRNLGGNQSSKSLHRNGQGVYSSSQTIGWQPGCTHDHDPVPAVVLDPFAGSGTTGLVARKHGRRAVLIELNPDYCALAARRLQQQSLFA